MNISILKPQPNASLLGDDRHKSLNKKQNRFVHPAH